MMLLYEFLYTGIGQFNAAYAPNATAAALANPVFIFTMVGYCGVFVPYEQIVDSLRYCLYWINPFNYLMGDLSSSLVGILWLNAARMSWHSSIRLPTRPAHNISGTIWRARTVRRATF